MKASFLDIKDRIDEQPRWYDENGTPRYEEFSPDLSPNIYADEVILIEIACQHCREKFLVEMNWGIMHVVLEVYNKEPFSVRLTQWLRNRNGNFCPIHYGDPPNHMCIGDTMNCIDLRIIEFHKKIEHRFERIKKFEIELEKDEEEL